MAKYKIKVIQHLLKNNKIAKSGDIVDGSQLPNEKLSLKGGYVELVAEKKENDSDEFHDLSSYTKNELIDYAKLNDFEIDKSNNKKDLLESILSQVSE